MKIVSALFFLFVSLAAAAQPKRHLAFDLAPSLHGSGDLLGPFVNIEYGKYVNRRSQWTVNFGTSIHSSEETVLVNTGGSTRDASYRRVTAGLQLGLQFWAAPVRSVRHELAVGLGPLVRYQSSNASGGYSLYLLPGSGPAFSFYNNEPQNIFSVGYQFGLAYAYTFRKGFLLGLKAGLQNDTNADIMTHVGLRMGKRF